MENYENVKCFAILPYWKGSQQLNYVSFRKAY